MSHLNQLAYLGNLHWIQKAANEVSTLCKSFHTSKQDSVQS